MSGVATLVNFGNAPRLHGIGEAPVRPVRDLAAATAAGFGVDPAAHERIEFAG
jgi:hypothetical protein